MEIKKEKLKDLSAGIKKLAEDKKTEEGKKESSEFGRGLVICLAKFRSHFESKMFQNPINAYFILKGKTLEEIKVIAEGKNYSADVRPFLKYFYMRLEDKTKTIEQVMGMDMSLFMNGASDHLYEIEVPKKWKDEKVATMVEELKSKALEIGHGSRMMSLDVTYEEIQALWELTDEILLEVDRLIGLDPDQGQY